MSEREMISQGKGYGASILDLHEGYPISDIHENKQMCSFAFQDKCEKYFDDLK